MQIRFGIVLAFLLAIAPVAARPQDNSIALAVSPVLRDSGLTGFLLPRFSLKTGVLIDLSVLDDEAILPDGSDVIITTAQRDTGSGPAQPVMKGFENTFFVSLTHPRASDTDETARTRNSTRLVDWLMSDVGKRTIEQFSKDGAQLFTAADALDTGPVQTVLSGDENSGKALAYRVCGRCHVIGARNRMKGLGSTPSFALMRTFDDWQNRFEAFYTLIPHPSFTQITEVTDPFDPTRPPAISPVVLTPDQLEDIVAFVATIEPANLGAPIVHQ